MSDDLVDKIARAVLYEGYILYPYRPSVKNSQRWTFGGIFPRDYCQAHEGTESAAMQAQCLIHANGSTAVSITLRFLHLVDRLVEQAPAFNRVHSLRVGDRDVQCWQEAVEREVCLGPTEVMSLQQQPLRLLFSYPASEQIEPLQEGQKVVGRIVRRQQAIEGLIEVSASNVHPEQVQLTIRVTNETPAADLSTRDAALLHSMASTHFIVRAMDGTFISLTDPPESAAPWAAQCENVGCWPVLAGEANRADTLLISPIILPDYPQIAPESPGDLFDGTEIDEILTLRIMTLTDEEKRQAASVDERVRQMLQRTSNLGQQQLMELHGTIRGDPSQNSESEGNQRVRENWHQPWDPLEERKSLEQVLSAGVELRPGDRVRLRPRGDADIFDIALAGRLATIAAIEQDYENQIHLAVTIDEDPGQDFGVDGKPGHRFFFKLDEVELVNDQPQMQ